MSSRQSKRLLSRCSEIHYSIMKAMEAIAISTFYDIRVLESFQAIARWVVNGH